MAKTAVVNKRRKRSGGGSKPKRRRRNYGAAATNPPKRRRRRRNPAPAPRRRSNTRRRNPDPFNMDNIMDTLPAATGGVWLGRWAVKQAGPGEVNDKGQKEPGIKHAIAIWLAATVGADFVANIMGSATKGEYARIACLGYGGDLFMRKRFMRDSEWVKNNLSLSGLGEDWEDEIPDYEDEAEDYTVSGFQAESPLGAVNSYTDATGNRYVMTAQGWQLAGNMGADTSDLVIGPDGSVYQLSGGGGATYPNDYPQIMADAMNGFQSESPLGMRPARADSNNSFGYA